LSDNSFHCRSFQGKLPAAHASKKYHRMCCLRGDLASNG
jgi:hypothetical protein